MLKSMKKALIIILKLASIYLIIGLVLVLLRFFISIRTFAISEIINRIIYWPAFILSDNIRIDFIL